MYKQDIVINKKILYETLIYDYKLKKNHNKVIYDTNKSKHVLIDNNIKKKIEIDKILNNLLMFNHSSLKKIKSQHSIYSFYIPSDFLENYYKLIKTYSLEKHYDDLLLIGLVFNKKFELEKKTSVISKKNRELLEICKLIKTIYDNKNNLENINLEINNNKRIGSKTIKEKIKVTSILINQIIYEEAKDVYRILTNEEHIYDIATFNAKYDNTYILGLKDKLLIENIDKQINILQNNDTKSKIIKINKKIISAIFIDRIKNYLQTYSQIKHENGVLISNLQCKFIYDYMTIMNLIEPKNNKSEPKQKVIPGSLNKAEYTYGILKRYKNTIPEISSTYFL